MACNGSGRPSSDASDRFGVDGAVDEQWDVSNDAESHEDVPTDLMDANGDVADSDSARDMGSDAMDDAAKDAVDAVLDGGDTSEDASAAFSCIDGWPQPPAAPAKQASLATQPRVLWSIPLSSSRVQRVLAATGSGVAFTAERTLTIVDGAGNVTAQVPKSGMVGYLSSPIADANGDLYFADSTAAYRVDGMGREVWRRPLGPYQGTDEVVSPWTPIMDASGRLYVSGLDNTLWVLRGNDGQVIANYPLGRSRSLAMGVADVLLMDRTGMSATAVPSLGLFAPSTGTWVGEIASFGASVPGAFAGFQIGLVAYGWVDTNSETSATVIYDRCGRRRWRVPGNHSWPLAIGFGDELITEDKTPLGGGTYSYSIRRFSRDGVLLAGPFVSSALCAAVVGQLGADDTLYVFTADASGTSVVALDATLNQLWSVPLGNIGCNRYLLNADGKLFVAGSNLIAVQTTSPGPALVSWGRTVARDGRGTSWLAP
jgi:hypothetical protein